VPSGVTAGGANGSTGVASGSTGGGANGSGSATAGALPMSSPTAQNMAKIVARVHRGIANLQS
jgi:hypothetical protein